MFTAHKHTNRRQVRSHGSSAGLCLLCPSTFSPIKKLSAYQMGLSVYGMRVFLCQHPSRRNLLQVTQKTTTTSLTETMRPNTIIWTPITPSNRSHNEEVLVLVFERFRLKSQLQLVLKRCGTPSPIKTQNKRQNLPFMSCDLRPDLFPALPSIITTTTLNRLSKIFHVPFYSFFLQWWRGKSHNAGSSVLMSWCLMGKYAMAIEFICVWCGSSIFASLMCLCVCVCVF